VAPDHQSIKAVSRRYEKVALSDNVRFVGNVTVGSDVTIPELARSYDSVVLATGAPDDRGPSQSPGSDLPGVIGSAAFVGWYNGPSPNSPISLPPLHVEAAGHRQRQCSRSTSPASCQDSG
jgi:ferredoxin--NADP+ reductase